MSLDRQKCCKVRNILNTVRQEIFGGQKFHGLIKIALVSKFRGKNFRGILKSKKQPDNSLILNIQAYKDEPI